MLTLSQKKRCAALMIALITALTAIAPLTAHADNENYLFIDGENITRLVNTAVIYRNVASTGQNQWGQNAVIDADGKVTAVYDGGDSFGADVAVPEGGAVISAAGTKAQWLRDNLKVGVNVYYDEYSSRIFAYKVVSDIDPYGTFSYDVDGPDENGDYIIKSPVENINTLYPFEIITDQKGVIISRGTNLQKSEGDKKISFYGDDMCREAVMHAYVGGTCTINGGKAVFAFDSKMLARSLELAVNAAADAVNAAKAAFSDGDYITAETIYDEAAEMLERAKDPKTVSPNYRETFGMISKLEKIPVLLSDNVSAELRAAFYAPQETTVNEVKAVVEKAAAAGLNKLILKLSNGYGTFLPLPEGYKFAQDDKFGGFDVLSAYIDACARAGIGLEVCVDVYYNEYAAAAEPNWVTVPNGEEQGMAAKFFSPASDEFKEYFLDYLDYLITHYEIGGLVLDWARYPRFYEECDLGYDQNTVRRFAEQYSLDEDSLYDLGTKLFSHENWNEWVEFKCGLVTDMVISVSDMIRKKRPDMYLTAVAQRENVNYYYMQDITLWLEEGFIDGAVLSVFDHDADENDSIPLSAYDRGIITEKSEIIAAYAGNSKYFFTGISSVSMLDADQIERMIIESRDAGADGIIFSDFAGLTAQHYDLVLKDTVFRSEAVAPGDDGLKAARAITEYSKNKINGLLTELEGCDEETAAQAFAAINEAMAKAGENGLSADEAKELESEIAMIFSRSEAKAAAVKDFTLLKKFAVLAKSDYTPLAPPDESQTSDTEDISEEPGEEPSEPVSESEESDTQSETVSEDEGEGVQPAKILAFVFVGITLAAAAAALAVGLKRRKKSSDRIGIYSSKSTNNDNEKN